MNLFRSKALPNEPAPPEPTPVTNAAADTEQGETTEPIEPPVGEPVLTVDESSGYVEPEATVTGEPVTEPPRDEPEKPNGEADALETLGFEPVAEAVVPEPLKPLTAGAFLNGKYEIKEVLSRGPVNLYLAEAGDWGASDPRLIAERAHETAVELAVEAEIFPTAERFAQGGREYAVYAFEMLSSFDDWNPPTNDEIYLSSLTSLTRGFLALKAAGLSPAIARESLFVTPTRQVRYLGFFESVGDGQTLAENAGVELLAQLSSRFAKRNLAHNATLRLDDEFGSLPLSDEVKSFARALSQGEILSLEVALEWLERFAVVSRTETALLGDVGVERELNEDSGLVWRLSRVGHISNAELEVLLVADGMGGHEGGEVASDTTVNAFQTALLKRLTLDWNDNSLARAAVLEICDEVNNAVIEMNQNPPYAALRNKPGATLVFAIRIGARVFIGNVGDSRAYRWNERNGLESLTKDHSYVQDLIDAGRLKPEEAWGHPDGSVITSNIGMPRGLLKDAYIRLLSPGDRLVLVSDGVIDTTRHDAIAQIVSEAASARDLAANLVETANQNGGIDNITVAAMLCF